MDIAPASLSLLPQQPAALAVPRALLLSFALVLKLFAARQRQFDLGASLFVEIKLKRDEGHALALHCANQLVDLPAMQQQLTRSLGRMVEAVGLQILRNIGVDQPDLAAAGVGIGFADRCLALTQRLYLRPGERDAGLHRVVDKIVEACLAVVGNDSKLAFRLLRH